MRESFDPLGGVRAGVGREASGSTPRPIVSMSSRPAIPWRVCAPAEPASASPAEEKFTMKAAPQASLFQRMGKPCLAGCLITGVHPSHFSYYRSATAHTPAVHRRIGGRRKQVTGAVQARNAEAGGSGRAATCPLRQEHQCAPALGRVFSGVSDLPECGFRVKQRGSCEKYGRSRLGRHDRARFCSALCWLEGPR